MYRLKKNIGIVLLFICGGFFSYLHAQTLTASTSQTTVQAGQEFQVQYSFNGNGSNFTPPSFNGFTVEGSMQGVSSSSGNGASSFSITYTFGLVANSEGTFTISPASIKYNGKTFTSNPLSIKVVKGAVSQNNSQPPANNVPPTAAATVNSKNFFIRAVPNKSKVYIGEAVTVTLKIYYRQDYSDGQLIEIPDYNGFYTEDISQSSKTQSTGKESLNGLTYYVQSSPQKVIFPQHAGKITVGSYTGEFLIEQAVKHYMPMFGYVVDYQRIPCKVKTDPFTIDVMPLPKTEKQTSGAVGDFTFKGELDKNQVKANDPINLTITISGSGNLKLIDTLPVRIPPDFDRYDPKITDHFTVSGAGMSGSRTYNYLLVPRHAGSYKIAPVEFTYFNPKTKGYVTLSTPEMSVDVAKGDNTSPVAITGTVNKEDVKMLGSDIRYIHEGHESFYRTDNFFLYSLPFFLGIFLPILLFIGFVIGRNRYMEMNKDALAVKKRKATSMAKKRLKIAHQSIAAGNKEVFYTELLNALNGYFSDKFSIPLADLSRDSITADLTQKNVKPGTIAMVNKTLDDCEFARFAPATVTGNLEEVYSSAVKLITLLEDEIS